LISTKRFRLMDAVIVLNIGVKYIDFNLDKNILLSKKPKVHNSRLNYIMTSFQITLLYFVRLQAQCNFNIATGRGP
jgi:hypothetical protein